MTKTSTTLQSLGSFAALSLAIANGAVAQQFPAKPIRIVVPFPASGPSDYAVRSISQQLPEFLGAPVVVDNRAGASGAIGAEHMARSPPDGYTLLVATVGILSIAPHLRKLSYDVARDFAPVTNLMGGPLWMLTHQSVPAHDIKGLIALAKARPGQLNYATSGLGQAAHLTGELFRTMAGIELVAVHYKGAAPALTDLLGGQMSIYFASTPVDVMQFVKAGRVRMPAVTSLQRSPATPEVPTMDESGLKLGIERFHLVGAKIGGTIAMRFAARESQRVASLTVLGSPTSGQDSLGDRIVSWTDHLEQHGGESWARWTMPGRLGSAFPPEGAEWWAKLMGRTPASTQLGFVSIVPGVDVTPDLPNIACSTLVITTEGSGLGSVEATRAWQQKIPRSELMVLPGDSYHVAATDADRCAQIALEFIRKTRRTG